MNIDKKIKNRNILFDILKGVFVGSGFIVPGVSGGAIAAIFGIYKPIINWLANITKDFWKNVKYFIPFAIGGVLGLVIFSYIVKIALGSYETIMMWSFVGTILGMLPSLWKDAAQEGRNRADHIVMIGSFLTVLAILLFASKFIKAKVEPSFISWFICGGLIALGILVPGLSPSNFILYMGMYKEMAEAFSKLEMSAVIPIGLGGLVTIFSLAKLIEYIFRKNYSKFYHFIFGVVMASTVMIIPTNYAGFTTMDYIWCLVGFIAGTGLGYWMSILEEKYK